MGSERSAARERLLGWLTGGGMILSLPLAIILFLLLDDHRWGAAAFVLAAGFAGAFAMVLLLSPQGSDSSQAARAPEPSPAHHAPEGELPVHPTTGLDRWWVFRERLRQEIARHDRHEHGFSVVLLEPADLLEGPTKEGYALAAKTLRHALRAGDLAAQFDEERFVVLLPETEKEEANATGRRLLSNLRSSTEEHLRWRGALVTYPQDGADPDALLERADALLRPGRLDSTLRAGQTEQHPPDGHPPRAA